MPHAVRPGDVVRVRDERWTVSRLVAHGEASIVDVTGCDRSNRGARARFILPFEPIQAVPAHRTVRVVRPRRWRRLARGVLSAALPSPDALRTASRADIRIFPFQLEPALAVTRGLASRVLIADDVGLGKTIQAGLIVAETIERVDEPHILVVVPAALRHQWAGELTGRFGLEPVIGDAATLSRGVSACIPGANPWSAHPLIVTSIDYIKRPEALRGLETLVWDLVVFDEAHALSTRSDRHRAAAALAERARIVLMLSATPHSGDDREFARLSGVGDLRPGFPLLAFRRTRADAGLAADRREVRIAVAPTLAERRMHTAMKTYARQIWRQRGAISADARLVAMILARRACSSAGALARSLERRLALLAAAAPPAEQLLLPLGERAGDDDEPGTELRVSGLHDASNEQAVVGALLELARAAKAGESKLAFLRRLIRRAGEPAIVFTEYRDTLGAIQSALPDVATASLHGGLSPTERNDVLDAFTAGRARVLLATDAASEGLNLHQRCRLVVNLELPWTPRRLEQRVGRVERIGQTRRVHEVNLLAAGTFEETTLAALIRKESRAREVVSGLRNQAGNERDVGDVVFGDALPGAAASTAQPDGVFTADLRESAANEAARIGLARELDGGISMFDHRPFVAAFPARVPRLTAYWTFRLEFIDSESELVWETLIALRAVVTRPERARADTIRRLADELRAASAVTVDTRHVAAALTLNTLSSRSIAQALSREQAILDAARHRHARIAATLLQPALFGTRTDRQAADQAAALHELIARCRTRLDRLARRRTLRAGSHDAVFGVFARR